MMVKADPVIAEIDNHKNIVPCKYVSTGNPTTVIAEMYETAIESATAN